MTDLTALLRQGWGFGPDAVRPLGGGMNSQTWLVEHAGTSYVAKQVDPSQRADLVTGCAIAASEAFVHDDATGVTGLIDWSGARRGPVLYDVASAVMYLGGLEDAAAFLETYRAEGPLGGEELDHLDAFRRFRWTVQATYFAWRTSVGDLTGLDDDSGNRKGLDDARRSLAALGLG
jgi:hypothetical protein